MVGNEGAVVIHILIRPPFATWIFITSNLKIDIKSNQNQNSN